VEQILKNNKMFESAISHAAAADTRLNHVSRVDLNVANGISRAVKELMINKVVLGWNGKITTTNFFFGSIIENLIGSSEQMVLVVKVSHPLNTINRIVVSVPENAECEVGFDTWLETIRIMAKRTSSIILFTGFENSLKAIEVIINTDTTGLKIEYQISNSAHPILGLSKIVTDKDLFVVIAARRRTLSFSHFFEHMPRDLARYYESKNFIIIYPEQRSVVLQSLSTSLDGTDASGILESNERFVVSGNYRRVPPDSRHNSLTE
jgi:hypothetical protein